MSLMKQMANKQYFIIILITIVIIIFLLYFFVFVKKELTLMDLKNKIATEANNKGITLSDLENGSIGWYDNTEFKIKVSTEKLTEFKNKLVALKNEVIQIKENEKRELANELIDIYINLAELPLKEKALFDNIKEQVSQKKLCENLDLVGELKTEQEKIFLLASSIESKSIDFYIKTNISTAKLDLSKQLEKLEKQSEELDSVWFWC